MEKAGYTRYVTDIFASTMKTNELSSIRTSCSPSNPPRSSRSAEARPATSSNCSRRVATRQALAAFYLNRWNAAVARNFTPWLILESPKWTNLGLRYQGDVRGLIPSLSQHVEHSGSFGRGLS